MAPVERTLDPAACRFAAVEADAGHRCRLERARRPRSAPIDAVAAALQAAAPWFQERGDYPRQRQAVIAANPELQERELSKLAALAAAIAGALRQRGVPEPAASLAAEAGIAVFRIAFDRWVSSTGQPDLTHLIQDSLDELKAVTAGN